MTDDPRSFAKRIEPFAFNAWPATETLDIGGWRLRFSAGQSLRANSVAVLGAPGAPLGEAVRQVADAYRARGFKPMFQITPAQEPQDLDRYLSGHGWTGFQPTDMMVAEARPGAPDAQAVISPTTDPVWRAVFRASSSKPRDAEERIATAERIARPCVFAVVRDADGAPVSIGLGVAEGSFGGIFCMRTIASARRRGFGGKVVRALSGALHALGARTLYLLVEQDNPAAAALYAKAGFRVAYTYGFRKLEE